MKTSVEHLYHFSCDRSKKWWAIGDFPWGSQSTLWCPWCGFENTLPEESMTGDDFMDSQKLLDPTPGEVYRHYKHNPAAGRWHEYEVAGVVEPFTTASNEGSVRTHWYFPTQYRHTDTEKPHTLTGCGAKIYAEVNEPHVAYKNTHPDLRDRKWVHCLRPLSEFVDGRFTLMGSAAQGPE